MKLARITGRSTFTAVVSLLVAGSLTAMMAAPSCSQNIVGVQTGATGTLIGQVEVTQTASTGPLKYIGLGGEVTTSYSIGTYTMSNGYTYKVNCGTGEVISAT